VTREQYIQLARDFLSSDPNRIRDANRALYGALVQSSTVQTVGKREADLALAEVAQGS
jgi:hypothetical protein